MKGNEFVYFDESSQLVLYRKKLRPILWVDGTT